MNKHSAVDAQNAAFYSADSRTYDAARFSDHAGTRETRRLHNLLARRLVGPRTFDQLIDVGCGTGRASEFLVQHTQSLTLVDISDEMVEAARARCLSVRQDALVDGVVSSVYSLPFEDESFTAAVSINLFSHLPDYVGALREIGRVLKPGAPVVFSTPNLYSVYWPFGALVNRRKRALGYEVFSYWPSSSTVRQALGDAGFLLAEVDGAVYLPRGARRIPLSDVVVHAADTVVSRWRTPARVAPWLLWTAAKV